MRISLDNGADIESKNRCGDSLLSVAASWRNFGVCEFLLGTVRLERDELSTDGSTPLSYAAELGSLYIVIFLLDMDKAKS